MNKYELGPSPIPNNITLCNPDGEPVMVITKDSITVREGVTVDDASQAVIAALEKYIKALVAAEKDESARLREAQRNELAARAMEGLVSQLNLYHVSVDEVAELSYRQADAMLKEREK